MKILIVGSGLSGATLARKFADDGHEIIVIDKRDHIGGNVYDYINDDGILVSKYGAHIFHTSHEEVWKFVNRFSNWRPYEHRVLSFVNGQLVPVPVNIDTVNKLFHLNIKNEEEMKVWHEKEVIKIKEPKNSEEVGLSRVGKKLYEMMFKNYTKKQWGVYPRELESSVLARIPIRLNKNDRYFSDKYEAIPMNGYTELVKEMLNHVNITYVLNFDYSYAHGEYDMTFYTGPIDRYFEDKFGKLEYRSLKFVDITLDKEAYTPGVAVVNFPEEIFPYTRIVEHKRIYGQKHSKTTITLEFSSDEGEPYYPFPNEKNRKLYAKYQKEAVKLEKEGIYFVGRLANYKYFNMDQAIKNALDLYERIKDEN